MINIVIPMAGENIFFDNSSYYPKPLIEIGETTLIESVIKKFQMIKDDLNFIFIINKQIDKKFHLSDILKIITNNRCTIIKTIGKTKGAACSILLAIKYIDNNIPLIVSNYDQIINIDFNTVINSMMKSDGGVITFESIHPRWSFVKLNKEGYVVEVSEKRPISNQAIAGFYFFKEGRVFVESVMSMIKKDANINGNYYISPALNELILMNKKLIAYNIDNKNYYTFYTLQKVNEYINSKNSYEGT